MYTFEQSKEGMNFEMQRLNVIYEDNHIIVVEKIVNVPSQSDKTGDTDMLSMVKNYIKEKSPSGCTASRECKSKVIIFMREPPIYTIQPRKLEIFI